MIKLKYKRVVHHRDFMLLTAGTSLSTLGDQMGWIAVLWFTMSTHRSPLLMGLVGVCYMVPNIIVSPFVGMLLDRFSPVRMMIGDNTVQGLLFVMIPVLDWLHILPFWLLCIILVAAGTSSPMTTVGAMTLLPELISTDLLSEANAWDETLWQGASLAGPLIAGFFISATGASLAILLDGLSFWICALSLIFIRHSNSSPHEPAEIRRKSFPLFAGFTALASLPAVMLITVVALLLNVAYGQLDIALPLLVHRELHLGGTSLGILLTANAVGSIIGTSTIGLLRVEGQRGILMSSMVAGMGLSLLPVVRVGSFWLLAVLMFAAGVSFGPYGPVARTVVQELVPRDLRGRVFGLRMSIMGTGVPLGSLAAGVSLELLRPSTLISVTGTAVLILGVGVLVSKSWRTMK